MTGLETRFPGQWLNTLAEGKGTGEIPAVTSEVDEKFRGDYLKVERAYARGMDFKGDPLGRKSRNRKPSRAVFLHQGEKGC